MFGLPIDWRGVGAESGKVGGGMQTEQCAYVHSQHVKILLFSLAVQNVNLHIIVIFQENEANSAEARVVRSSFICRKQAIEVDMCIVV